MIKITFVSNPLDPLGSLCDAEQWLNTYADFWLNEEKEDNTYDIFKGDVLKNEDDTTVVGWISFHNSDAIVWLNDGVINLVRHHDPEWLREGDSVLLLRDDGEYEHRIVKYGSWKLGHGKLVVGLHGLAGGWDADRIYGLGGSLAAKPDKPGCPRCCGVDDRPPGEH